MSFPLELEDDERIGAVCWCGGCAGDPCDLREHEAKAYSYAAAAAFGLMGMAEAIGRIQSIEACDGCGRASQGWVTEMAWPYTRRCLKCADAKYAAECRP